MISIKCSTRIDYVIWQHEKPLNFGKEIFPENKSSLKFQNCQWNGKHKTFVNNICGSIYSSQWWFGIYKLSIGKWSKVFNLIQ